MKKRNYGKNRESLVGKTVRNAPVFQQENINSLVEGLEEISS